MRFKNKNKFVFNKYVYKRKMKNFFLLKKTNSVWKVGKLNSENPIFCICKITRMPLGGGFVLW